MQAKTHGLVRTQSQRILFVNGQNDPWGSERFTPSAHDSHSFTAPGANHGAKISVLSGADRIAATDVLRRWAGSDVWLNGTEPVVDPSQLDVVRTPFPF
ncbi:hypothetical protein [Allokutzneria albata]|uniref:PS-10 peptidase S37 n=1 Tax=Allokutzneria albata TaxID=211114 RepID=A0A1G9WET0_ALLAB|nr:hypothetical protein [Allokutzneria albata]SDM82686.1 PS-10 peptidase S37 [Allokutzneria albata]